LFGVWYSGLEYDYRGLAYLYEETSKKRISYLILDFDVEILWIFSGIMDTFDIRKIFCRSEICRLVRSDLIS